MKKYIIALLLITVVCIMLSGCSKIRNIKNLFDFKLAVSGTCGEDLEWKYDRFTGTLTITGSGAMDSGNFLWRDHSIRSLSLPEGLTVIDRDAFYGHSELQGELVIPSTVTEIQDFAFYGCSGLTGALVLPDGITKISDYSFRGCEGLTSVVIPEGVSYIGEEAFDNCIGFSGGLSLPSTLTGIARSAFYGCKNLTGDLVIPDSVTYIGSYAFSCTGFDGTLTLSKNLTEISDNVFNWGPKFKGDLVIPDGVETIGDNAFNGCGFGGRLDLPSSLREIGMQAFSHCEGLTGDLKIGKDVRLNGHDIFSSTGFTSVELDDSLKFIPDGTFSNCASISGELHLPVSLVSIGGNAFTGCKGISGVLVIPDGVVSIGYSAFYGCSGISSVRFGDELLNIHSFAFADSGICDALMLPDSLVYLGEYAFYNCGISSVSFGSGIHSVAQNAFIGCSGLEYASFSGQLADYYRAGEQHPSFPDTCDVRVVPGAKNAIDFDAADRSNTENGSETGGSSSGDAKDMPYIWTESLDTYRGIGAFADTELKFRDGFVYVAVNGRDYSRASYEADPWTDERVVHVTDLPVKNGVIGDLYACSVTNARILRSVFTAADGTTSDIFFTDESETDVLIGLEYNEISEFF